jgi:hypothetical protein
MKGKYFLKSVRDTISLAGLVLDFVGKIFPSFDINFGVSVLIILIKIKFILLLIPDFLG